MYTYRVWNLELAVGVDVVDKQHKIIFDLINDLGRSIEMQAMNQLLEKKFEIFENYTFRHFNSEEKLLEGHQDRVEHTLLHYRLIRELNFFKFQLRHQKSEEKQIHPYLLDWFVNHISESDIPIFSDVTSQINKHDVNLLEQRAPIKKGSLDRRRQKRIPRRRISDHRIFASCHNLFTLKVSKVAVIDLSSNGIRFKSYISHNVGDLLIIDCNIGKSFNLREKIRVVDAVDHSYGAEFINLQKKSERFILELYGSIGGSRNAL